MAAGGGVGKHLEEGERFRSDRDQASLLDQGPAGQRGMIDSTTYAYGIRPVAPGTPGALSFAHPITGGTVFGADIRPGIDTAVRTSMIWNLEALQATNDDDNERFIHNAVQADLTWVINETTWHRSGRPSVSATPIRLLRSPVCGAVLLTARSPGSVRSSRASALTLSAPSA
jgi:hypothetical protein